MNHDTTPLPSPVLTATSDLYSLPDVPYLRLTLFLRALAPARLPPFMGSTLRGAFGHALRRTVCAMGPDQPCASCRLRRACVYPRIFETFVEGTPPPLLRGLTSSPRPYVFETRFEPRSEPGNERQDFAPGDPFEFDLLLIGQAVELQAYVLLAVERMAASGLGVSRAPFELVRAEAHAPGGRLILFQDGRATGLAAPPSFCLGPAGLGSLEEGQATIRLLTPLRLQERGHLSDTLDFRALTLAMLRRTLELAWFHVPGAEVDWTFHPLLDRAAAVRATPDLAWHDWDRYSNRQQRKVTLGGLLGTLELEGDLAPFAPLLRAAEILHVGKGATLGLGRIRVE